MRNLFVLCLILFAHLSFSMYKSAGASGGNPITYNPDRAEVLEGRLSGVQMYLHMDVSGSMKELDKAPSDSILKACNYHKPKDTDWMRKNTLELLSLCFITPMLEHDEDKKIPVNLFSDDVKEFVIESSEDFKEKVKIFPRGRTEMEKSLALGFKKQEPPTIYNRALHVVLTDGAPTKTGCDEDGARDGIIDLIEKEIVRKDLHTDDKCSVLFVQIGRDRAAKKYLDYMDDCEKIGRCVDVKTEEQVFSCVAKHGSVAPILKNAIFEDDSEFE